MNWPTYIKRVIYFSPGKLGPYHIAKFLKLAKIYPNLCVANVLWEDHREWRFEPGDLADRLEVIGSSPETATPKGKIESVIKLLERKNPEAVVLAGYNDPTQIAAARWAKQHRVARIMHADSWYGDHPRYYFKEIIKRLFFVAPNFDAAFVPGIRGYEYIKHLGIPENAIWRGLYVVDNDYFAKKAMEARQEQEAWQSKLSLPQNYFLSVARFVPEKNLFRLIQAYGQYKKLGGSWQLIIVGGGPQEEQLRKLCSDPMNLGLMIVNWQQYEVLPVFYAMARCFILPSLSEPWGLVVNEAMACGLPVLVSRNTGCFPELCHRGINGFDFDPLDVDGLSRLMLHLSQNSSDLETMGAVSYRIIKNYSLDTWALAIQDCIETTVARGNQ